MSFHVYPLLQSLAPTVVKNAVSWSSMTGGALLNTEWGATEISQTLDSAESQRGHREQSCSCAEVADVVADAEE